MHNYDKDMLGPLEGRTQPGRNRPIDNDSFISSGPEEPRRKYDGTLVYPEEAEKLGLNQYIDNDPESVDPESGKTSETQTRTVQTCVFNYPDILPEPRVDLGPVFQERADLNQGLKIYDILANLHLSYYRDIPESELEKDDKEAKRIAKKIPTAERIEKFKENYEFAGDSN